MKELEGTLQATQKKVFQLRSMHNLNGIGEQYMLIKDVIDEVRKLILR